MEDHSLAAIGSGDGDPLLRPVTVGSISRHNFGLRVGFLVPIETLYQRERTVWHRGFAPEIRPRAIERLEQGGVRLFNVLGAAKAERPLALERRSAFRFAEQVFRVAEGAAGD